MADEERLTAHIIFYGAPTLRFACFDFRFTTANLGGLSGSEKIVGNVHEALGAHLEVPALGGHFDEVALLEFERIEDPLGNHDLASLPDAADWRGFVCISDCHNFSLADALKLSRDLGFKTPTQRFHPSISALLRPASLGVGL